MYFERKMLCPEWIVYEFQGAFLHGGFKIRYAFPVHLRVRMTLPGGPALSSLSDGRNQYNIIVKLYKIEWDTETGGVLLTTHNSSQTVGIAPRPVFFEELDLLELPRFGWEYPQCPEPLMWAVNKQYYYRGQLMFTVKGADIYTKPAIKFTADTNSSIKLIPVDMTAMLRRNEDIMFMLEYEAIEFIRDTYIFYVRVNKAYNKSESNKIDFEALICKLEKQSKQKMALVQENCDSFDIVPLDKAKYTGKKVILSSKIDKFIASFSGGKDSQVVLDLCTRAIPPNSFEVIYSDTGYELPASLQLYEETQALYHTRFPMLNFLTAKNHESVLNYWDKIGTPSDSHRWCCSVMKTSPLYRLLRSGIKKKNPKFLAFEGVRAEESNKRSEYARIGKGVKHNFVINARPILRWNTTEVFLYLFRHNLPVNAAYRVGKPRVGCILCPFGSPWDDMIVNTCYPNELKPFLSRIEAITEQRNIPNKHEYITERKWKLRSSGKFSQNPTTLRIETSPIEWVAEVKGAQKDIFDWLPALCAYSRQETSDGFVGDLLFNKNVYNYEISYGTSQSDFTFIVQDNNNVQLRTLLRKTVNKVTYCINCEACELECPTGALSVYPKVKIDKSRCIHCHRCLEYHNVGCIVADSLIKPTANTSANMKISKYGTFGLHAAWLDEFFADTEGYWEENSLGVKQLSSFKAWLKDAEIIDDKGLLTEFGELCSQISQNGQKGQKLLWELIHINLVHNSPLMKWYVNTINVGFNITRKNLDQLALEHFLAYFKDTTIKYAVQALIQTFKYSPIGVDFNQCCADREQISRSAYAKLSPEAVAYSLFKYGQANKSSMFQLSDLYGEAAKCGPYREFGTSQNDLSRALRYLSSTKNRVLTAALNMGLNHITLSDNYPTASSALKSLLNY